jgi:DNA-directed RNA polymerase subunit RPC12/RpoP
MSLKRVGEILECLRGLACPHCGSGSESHTVGLVWDSREQNWRCFICGCRVYEGEVKRPSCGDTPDPAGLSGAPLHNSGVL